MTPPRADRTAAVPEAGHASPSSPLGSQPRAVGSEPASSAARRDGADLRALIGLGVATLMIGEVAGVTTCPWAGLLGVPCPGCGLTRATWAILNGHPADAIALHPFVVVAVPALGIMLLLLALRRGVPDASWLASPRLTRIGERVAVAIALAMVALWLARFLGACHGPVPVDPWFR